MESAGDAADAGVNVGQARKVDALHDRNRIHTHPHDNVWIAVLTLGSGVHCWPGALHLDHLP